MRKTPASLSVRVRTAVAAPALLALLLIFPGAACAAEKGTVKWYDAAKGIGFITPDDGGADVFVNAKEVGATSLQAGQRVSFSQQMTSRGHHAGQLTVLDVTDAAPPGSSQSPAPAAEPATSPAPAEEAANDSMASDEHVADEDTAAEEEEESDDTGAADEDSAAEEDVSDEAVSDEAVSDEEVSDEAVSDEAVSGEDGSSP